MTIRRAHFISALVMVAFACMHIANHLAALSGVGAHIAFMEAARKIYRNPFVEPFLLLSVAFQICSGAWLVVRGWSERRGLVAWLQAGAGLYLAAFLAIHVSAVLFGRAALDLDTNFYFAAAGFHVAPFQFFFAPYYFLAVAALFTHLGCAATWMFRPTQRLARLYAIAAYVGIGSAVSLAIILCLNGTIRPVHVPANYLATYAPPD